MNGKSQQGSRRRRESLARAPWQGSVRKYDLFKELSIGMVVVGLLVVGLSAVVGSPDEPSVTLKSWATAAPSDFIATTAAELSGDSETAGYGPPYNTTPDATQKLGPIDLQSLSGARIPIDTANDFVIDPLRTLPTPPAAVADWTGATDVQRSEWATAYADALENAPDHDPAKIGAGDYGPVPALASALLAMAQQGALDPVLTSKGSYYNTNYTASILFLGDGTYFPGLADEQHLTGDQWGMMNETGNYPGQSWLWLFSFLYQVEPFKSSPDADVLAVFTMAILTLLLTLLPFIPGLRSLPRWIPVQRLIWKDYYKRR